MQTSISPQNSKNMKFLLSVLLTASSAFAFSTLPKVASPSTTQLAESSSPSGAKDISALTKDLETVFTTEQIDEILPHRYPFALVDKVIEYEAGKRAVGVKSVTKVGTIVSFWTSLGLIALLIVSHLTFFASPFVSVLICFYCFISIINQNEEFFNGHFPGRPIMPGVLQVEAMAQLAGIVCLQMEGAAPGAVFFFAGVDGVKWKKPVVPGDTLVMEVEIKKWNAKFGLAKATGKAYVDGDLVVEVDQMTFALAK